MTQPAAVTATAPGKLMLLGEYAVLEGAPALVAAVNRRASATLTTRSTRDFHITAPDLGIDTCGALDADSAMTWGCDHATAKKLRLVESALCAAAHNGALPGCDVTLSTSEFFGARTNGARTGGERIPDGTSYLSRKTTVTGQDPATCKLGLGSSAALGVALTGAINALSHRPPASLADHVAIHRKSQQGRGSGADVGASLAGGVVIYRGGNTDTPATTAAALPSGVTWCCVFTGTSASTPQFLRHVGAFRDTHPARYRSMIRALADAAEAGVHATTDDDAARLLSVTATYRDLLAGLGHACGADIISDVHQAIGDIANRYGIVYKPSGAGGGDVGIGLTLDPDASAAFAAAASKNGFTMVDLTIDPLGLEIEQQQ